MFSFLNKWTSPENKSVQKNLILRKGSLYDEICKRCIVYVESSIQNRVSFFPIQIKYGKVFCYYTAATLIIEFKLFYQNLFSALNNIPVSS